MDSGNIFPDKSYHIYASERRRIQICICFVFLYLFSHLIRHRLNNFKAPAFVYSALLILLTFFFVRWFRIISYQLCLFITEKRSVFRVGTFLLNNPAGKKKRIKSRLKNFVFVVQIMFLNRDYKV